MTGDGQPAEGPLAAIEGSRVEQRQECHEQRQEQIGAQFHGTAERQGGNAEQRLPATEHAEDAVGYHAGDPRGNDDLGLELGRAVQDLRGEHRPGQGGAEDRCDARAHARRHEDAAVGRTQPQDIGQQRAEAGPDLRDGALASAGAARPEGHRAGDDLDQRNPGPDQPVAVMVRTDDGVGAVALGLGRQLEDEDAADETAEREDQQQQPRMERPRYLREPGQDRFAEGTGVRLVSGPEPKGIVLRRPRGDVETDAGQSGDDAD